MIKSDSIKNISGALLKAQSEMGNAVKGASNPFFKSRFADLNSIREVSLPVLNKYGITVLQPTTIVDGRNYVETTLLHESGEFLASLTEVIVGKVNDPQAHGSGLSYSRRYGLQAFLCIGAEDNDAEGAMSRGPAKTTTVSAPAATVTPITATTEAPKRASFRKNVAAVVTTSGDDI